MRETAIQRWTAANAITTISGVKLYGVLVLFVLFLRTDFRNGDKGFIFRGVRDTLPARCDEIDTKFTERLAPWDGQWYLDIAENGYRRMGKAESLDGRHPPANIAFFPLLPAILRLLRETFGHEAGLLLALAVNVVAAAAGTFVVWRIAEVTGVSGPATIALLLAFPTAVFQYALYTEAVFVFLSSLALLAILRQRAVLATGLSFLAGLTRPQGVLLSLPLAASFLWPALKERPMVSKVRLLGTALLPLAPLSGYAFLFLISRTLDDSSGVAFISIQSRWGREIGPLSVFHALGQVWGYKGPPADLIGLGFGLLLLPVLWRRLPIALSLYGTAMVLMPLSTGTILSLGRFMSVSVAHFLALAALLDRRPRVVVAVVLAFAVLQVLVANGLIQWYLVG